MSVESATPDLVELTRQGIDAGNRRDLDAVMSLYAPDVVSESLDGLGFAWAITWEHGLAVHYIAGMDIDGVRAAAERLAEERR